MAKVHKFEIKLVKARFADGFASVSISDLFNGAELSKHPFEGTLEQALEARRQVSFHDARPHAAFLDLVDNSARKPAGFDAKSKVIYGGEGSK